MSIFQKTVLKSINQDESLIALRWASFQKFLAKVEYIKTVKEEKYQDGFLVDIFENCLGYTLDMTNPKSFNLEREKKNETDSKKADGVIYLNSEIIAVIELKDTKTKNLDRVQQQAFWYLTQHTKAKYVIISNFDELRFYFDKSTAYESFSLFNLSYDEFCKLHLLLSFENIKDETALKIKEKSNSFEQDISKKLYKDFSHFRTLLFENIVKNNPTIDKQTLLRLTQKLCDRIIFILFAEDRDLLRSNMIKEIREEFINQKFTNYSLYDIYKFYFEAINKGNDKLQIPQYNGGLFATDLLLDSLIIDDFILDENVQILSNYDFASEISVNILGHIFEQSLTDLEELQANIDNVNFDKTKSKRKKDGVFYTPEYITRYIVENTLGKMCSERREELKIVEITPPSNPKKLTKQEQQTKENLQEYKNWLLNLKILDPACGSGAFLNQALEYLISEHKNLQNDLALMGDLFTSYMVEEEILEHNLYGVDINEDAVEIAKLSLWLRTAKRGRALTKLADKIVCANSLLNMPFSENSFDVVIGNPPYVRVQGLKSNYENESKLYEEKFVSATGNYDLYALFLEMSFKMLNQKGKLSYILPHKFLISDFGSGIRGFLSENKAVESLLHFGSEMVFEDASTYTCIINLSHNNKKLDFKSISPNDIFNPFQYDSISYENLNSDKWNLSSNDITKVLEKIDKQPLKVKNIFKGVFQGIVSGDNKAFYLSNCYEKDNFIFGKHELIEEEIKIEKELARKILNGKTIKRYGTDYNDEYIIYTYKILNNKTQIIDEEILKLNYPYAYNLFLKIYDRLSSRGSKNMNYPTWYSLWNFRNIINQSSKKILTPDICFKPTMWFDENAEYFYNDTSYALILKDTIEEDYKFFLTILNSSLMWFYLLNTSAELRGGYFRFKTKFIEPFSIPKLKNLEQQEPFIQKADLMLELNKKLQELKQNFINELNLEKVPTKLQKFEELDFDDFVKEYAKAKKLKFADKLEERNFKNEWQRLFENDKKEVLEIQNQINITDKEIDQMVYKLYDLTPDEIKIVENN
ncbi:Eco57I restriction-modification methylase domain-containing protein [Aliarcobacter skirrowii]|uniref:Eco57I restriction-modification methylase domain-containing protein n=1 Tax=Aliarcobacter skirrowii TaxID=28200 RepID=UPI002A365C25|nr:N-6 DNA methylase [Aliarcobacter skirrowii]MDY0180347.1 N-6 DNA methylase [Aliarcobacter skirrowii]